MITYYIAKILLFFISVLVFPLRVLPNVSLDPNIAASLAAAMQYVSILDVVVPVGTLIAVLTGITTIELAIFAYKLIRWVYRKIPGIS